MLGYLCPPSLSQLRYGALNFVGIKPNEIEQILALAVLNHASVDDGKNGFLPQVAQSAVCRPDIVVQAQQLDPD
jgi:hypothetical protein